MPDLRRFAWVGAIVGPFIGLLGLGMWLAGWTKRGALTTALGLIGYVASIAVLWEIMEHFGRNSPSWYVPAAITAIIYAIAAPAAILAGIVAWDQQRKSQ